MLNSRRDKIQKLYRLYEQPLYRIAYAILHQVEDAEDAVSNAFLIIIQNIDKIGKADSVETRQYVISIIRSRAIDQYRKKSMEWEHVQWMDEEGMTEIPDAGSENGFERVVLGEEIQNLLNQMSADEQKIVTLRCEDELSWREIARECGLSEAAVRKRFERIRRKMEGAL